MMSTGKVLLTADDLLRWREEDKQFEKDINDLQEKRARLHRKIAAAEVFAETIPAPPPVETVSKNTGRFETQEDSIPSRLVTNLRETGEALTVGQIRQRLIDLGFAAKVQDQRNYHYAITHRLVKRRRLLKEGSLYRAAPTDPDGVSG